MKFDEALQKLHNAIQDHLGDVGSEIFETLAELEDAHDDEIAILKGDIQDLKDDHKTAIRGLRDERDERLWGWINELVVIGEALEQYGNDPKDRIDTFYHYEKPIRDLAALRAAMTSRD